MTLHTVEITGDLSDGGLNTVAGYILFQPPDWLQAAADSKTIPPTQVKVTLVAGQIPAGFALLATDNADLNPTGWTWYCEPHITGASLPKFFSFALPAVLGTIDFSALMPVSGNVGTGSVPTLGVVDGLISSAIEEQAAQDLLTYASIISAISGWATVGAFALSGSQTYDATYGTLTGAAIVWPDDATGVFASTGIDSTSTNPGGLTGFTATHILSGVTLTATVVIPRNGAGQVSGDMTVTVA